MNSILKYISTFVALSMMAAGLILTVSSSLSPAAAQDVIVVVGHRPGNPLGGVALDIFGTNDVSIYDFTVDVATISDGDTKANCLVEDLTLIRPSPTSGYTFSQVTASYGPAIELDINTSSGRSYFRTTGAQYGIMWTETSSGSAAWVGMPIVFPEGFLGTSCDDDD